MKSILSSFRQFLVQISKDSMLLVVILAPILAAILFKFGIPIAENLLTEHFNKITILLPYYLLFDIFLAVLTPYMFCFASAMVILEEVDSNLTGYLSVTPIGKSGYIVSRLGFPAILSTVFSILMLRLFSLTQISMPANILLSVLTACIGMIISMLIVSYSSNKVEGMALAKLGGLFMLGVPIPFFFTGTEQYFGAVLPSFWVARLMLDYNLWYLMGGVASILIWAILLFEKFKKKIGGQA